MPNAIMACNNACKAFDDSATLLLIDAYLDSTWRIKEGRVKLEPIVDNFVRQRRSIKDLVIHIKAYKKNPCATNMSNTSRTDSFDVPRKKETELRTAACLNPILIVVEQNKPHTALPSTRISLLISSLKPYLIIFKASRCNCTWLVHDFASPHSKTRHPNHSQYYYY